MAIEIPKVKNRNNSLVFIILILVLVVIFFVFVSLRKNLGTKVSDSNISKIIDEDTKELGTIGNSLDKNIDAVFKSPEFGILQDHRDIKLNFETGKTDPFNSF